MEAPSEVWGPGKEARVFDLGKGRSDIAREAQPRLRATVITAVKSTAHSRITGWWLTSEGAQWRRKPPTRRKDGASRPK